MADALPLGPPAGARGRRAAGPTATPPTGSRTTRRRCTTPSATGSRRGRRSTSRGARRCWPTARARTPPAGPTRGPPSQHCTTCCSATGWPCRCCATAASAEATGTGSVGITLNLSPVDPADPSSEADREVARRVDGLQNRVFLDPVLRGRYPAGRLGRPDAVRPAGPRPGRRPGHHRRADRRARRELLLHAHDARRHRAAPADDLDRRGERRRHPRGPPDDRDGLGDRAERSARHAGPAAQGVPRDAGGHHRERRRLRRPGGERRRRARRGPSLLPRGPPPRVPPGDRRRGRPARLPRVVADGQLRVGVRLLEALRHRARRLRHAAAHA